MPILSPEFAIFLLLFLPLYWSCRAYLRLQNSLLLLTNIGLLFYLQVIFALSVTGFSLLMVWVAWQLQRGNNKTQRRRWLWVGISFALAILAFFKYFDFFRPGLYQLGFDEVADIVMPLGLSYYVFQSIACLVAIYRGSLTDLKWHEMLLHFSFFLTITAGPIIRAERFKSIDGEQLGAIEQIRTLRSMQQPALALCLVLLGAVKVWWFSGNIATYFVNPVLNNPLQYSVAEILTAVYGYTLQLFFDFSGYSDLVIGLGLLLGFRLPLNFAAPLYAVNIRDFWARWHITLSTWIRDYIYIPLGGSRYGFWRTQVNLLTAMLLSGIWHGNSWNFFIWGALHGIALLWLNIKGQYLDEPDAPALFEGRLWAYATKIYAVFLTFNFVCFAFLIFKLTDLGDITAVLTALLMTEAQSTVAQWGVIALIYGGIIAYPLWIAGFQRLVKLLQTLPLPLWVIVIILTLQLMMLFAPSGIPGFIYADF